MPRPASQYPTELELQILKVLWESGPASARQARERLAPRRALAHTSVITMMNIMTRKGYLARKRSPEGTWVYRPRVTLRATAGKMLRDIVDRVFGGNALDAVVQLIDDDRLNPHELKELRNLVDRARKDDQSKEQP